MMNLITFGQTARAYVRKSAGKISRSLNVIESVTVQPATYDFLVVIYPVSYSFRDNRWHL